MNSRVWAEIDLAALAQNVALVRRLSGPEVAVWLVAKADAYGHGSHEIARAGLAGGARGVAVSCVEEALELRETGFQEPLLVLGSSSREECEAAMRAGVEFAVTTPQTLVDTLQAARAGLTSARVHLKIDTGMHRLGLRPDEALSALQELRRQAFVQLAGVFTHLSATDGNPAVTSADELACFRETLTRARKRLLVGSGVPFHVGNSAAVLSGLEPLYQAVRVGIAAYGVAPHVRLARPDLVPVLSLRARIVHLLSLRPGETAGYGGRFRAARETRLATVSAGYEDGIDRRLGDRGVALVRGRRSPFAGAVSMDFCALDVTDVPDVQVGDVVTFVGQDGASRIPVEEVAETIDTIPYELLCSIGRRVRRVVKREPAEVSSRELLLRAGEVQVS